MKTNLSMLSKVFTPTVHTKDFFYILLNGDGTVSVMVRWLKCSAQGHGSSVHTLQLQAPSKSLQ